MTGELNDTAHDRHGHVLCDIISNIKIEGGGGLSKQGIRLHTIYTIVEEVSRVLNHVECYELCDCG